MEKTKLEELTPENALPTLLTKFTALNELIANLPEEQRKKISSMAWATNEKSVKGLSENLDSVFRSVELIKKQIAAQFMSKRNQG